MKERKVIDYTRTYRRIEADKKKCILYIVILILLGFLFIVACLDIPAKYISSSHCRSDSMVLFPALQCDLCSGIHKS